MKGYLVLAQNGEENYIEQAYALALSIKNSQKISNFAVITNDKIPAKYNKVFDYVIPIPWTDQASGSTWKIENKWKYYYATPFDETIILDTDMLFFESVDNWWNLFEDYDVRFASSVKTFRGETVTSDYYRKTFVANNLPNVYTALTYFKKNELMAEITKLVQIIFENWQKFYYEYLEEPRPTNLSGDVAYALAVKILGCENEVCGKDTPSFVHMKSFIQNVKPESITEDWTKHFPSYFNSDCQLKVANYNQHLPFHYHIKSWLTPDIIKKLEKKYERRS